MKAIIPGFWNIPSTPGLRNGADSAWPDILLSGHHANIEKWRRRQSLLLTRTRRPDLFERLDLSPEDQKLLKEEESC